MLYIIRQSIMIFAYRLLILLSLLTSSLAEYQAAPYAQWAHSHVVWLNGEEQNQQKIYDLLEGYLAHNIPVGGVNIDSAWSTCFNNFQFDRKKFPNPQKLVKDFHAKGVKVILWATSILNTECAEYEEGKKNGYFLNKGKAVKWWHGKGAFIDFFNPDAKKWWVSLMDRVINMGFDGWKCDGADPLIVLLRPWAYSSHKKRYIFYHEYADEYYGTFYNYTKSKNPDALIMSRPVDGYQNKLFLSYSPKYVMFSGWVGDQHNDVQGFRKAMINVIHSASKNYLNFGFDISGYKSRGPTQKFLFIRWAQAGALLPFMENGGNGMHWPWLFDVETVDIYRKFVGIHYDLRQFFLTSGTEAFSKKKSVVQPLIPDAKPAELTNPSNLGYVLWNTFLVAPIFEESGYVEVIFPKGHKWMYYFDHSKVFPGTGVVQSMGIKIDQAAFFIRSNSIVPLKKELWLVYLDAGRYSKTVIGGDYSDDIEIDYSSANLSIRVDRYYKNEEVRQSRLSEVTIKVRIIGVSTKPTCIEGSNLSNSLQISTTQYENQFYVEVPLHQKVTIKADFIKEALIVENQGKS